MGHFPSTQTSVHIHAIKRPKEPAEDVEQRQGQRQMILTGSEWWQPFNDGNR